MKFTSPVFSAVSGSIAGVTYSHNKGGMYTRARAVPTNPNTVRQQATRASMNIAIQAWNDVLTDEDRQSWRDYAANTPVLDKLGQMKHLTGQQMWIRWSIAYSQTGDVDFPQYGFVGPNNTGEMPYQIVTGVTEVFGIGVNDTNQNINSKIQWAEDISDAGIVSVFLSGPLNDGINSYYGPYQRAISIIVVSGDETGWTTAQSALHNSSVPLVAGQRRAIRMRMIFNDGRVSQDYKAIVPVVAQTPP